MTADRAERFVFGKPLVRTGGALFVRRGTASVRRIVTPAMALKEGDPLPLAQKILETVAMGKVSTSAGEAREMGFLGAHDRVVMHRDHLLSEAKQEVLQMVGDGYMPPPPFLLEASSITMQRP